MPKTTSPRSNEKLPKVLQYQPADSRMKISNFIQEYLDRQSPVPSQQDSTERTVSETPTIAETIKFEDAKPKKCSGPRCNSRGSLDPYHFLSLRDFDSLTVECISCRLLNRLDIRRNALWSDLKDNENEFCKRLIKEGRKTVEKYGTALNNKQSTKSLPPHVDTEVETNRLLQILPDLVQTLMAKNIDNEQHGPNSVGKSSTPTAKGESAINDSQKSQSGTGKRRRLSTTSKESYIPKPEQARQTATLSGMLQELAKLPPAKRRNISNRIGLDNVGQQLELELSKTHERSKLYERLNGVDVKIANGKRQLAIYREEKEGIEKEIAELPDDSDLDGE